MFARVLRQVGALIVALPLVLGPAAAQDTEFSKEELDQLLAPIALYSDDLLSSVLMASTYPLEVVQAARWVKEPANAKLKGDALTKALEDQDWDPSTCRCSCDLRFSEIPLVIRIMGFGRYRHVWRMHERMCGVSASLQ